MNNHSSNLMRNVDAVDGAAQRVPESDLLGHLWCVGLPVHDLQLRALQPEGVQMSIGLGPFRALRLRNARGRYQ
ncbi:MAG: hypothetical protein P8N50_12230 [Actinomycetota bacterium]|jgi:hypothetical protein|nr:hypothetical protein [Actinomycetota bacterium]